MAFIRKYKRKGRVYLAEVENKRVDGKMKQIFIRHIGVEPDSDRSAFPSCNKDLSLDGVKVHGSILALDSIARLLGLHDILGPHFAPILALTYCHCHDYKGVADMKRWLSSANFYGILNVDEITEKDLYNAISAIEDMDVLSVQKSIFEKMRSLCDDDCRGVVYDVTNTYLRGTSSELAKKGKDKEGVRGRRLIQVGLGLTGQNRLPIFHQIHPGNTSDSKMFQEGIQLFRRFGVKRGTIVYDRGMHSNSNILDLSNIHWKVLGGVPINKGIKKFISKMDLKNLESYRFRVPQGNSTFYVKTTPYKFGKVKGRLAIVLNPQKRYALKERRLDEISSAQKNLDKIDKSLKKYFNINGKVNAHALKRIEFLDGLSAIFTDTNLSTKEMIKTYFDKDLIEKAFEALKSILGMHPIRHWLDGKIKGHLFICYLALVLMTTLRLKIQQSKKESLSTITPERAIKELQSIYIIEYSKASSASAHPKSSKKPFRKVVTLSNLQKDILLAIDKKIAL
jgi:transposase